MPIDTTIIAGVLVDMSFIAARSFKEALWGDSHHASSRMVGRSGITILPFGPQPDWEAERARLGIELEHELSGKI